MKPVRAFEGTYQFIQEESQLENMTLKFTGRMTAFWDLTQWSLSLNSPHDMRGYVQETPSNDLLQLARHAYSLEGYVELLRD